MTASGNATTLKVLIVILGLVVLALGGYTYKFYSELQLNQEQLKTEKEALLVDLKEEIARYNDVLAQKNAINAQLTQARSELELLQQKLTAAEATRPLVQQYQKALRELRKEREILLQRNDSLSKENERLASEKEASQKEALAQQESKDSLQNLNLRLANKLARGSKVTVSNLQARGVIQRTSGKLVLTQRARRAEMVQLCFTLNQNALAPIGDRTIYTQVLDQNNQIVGVKKTVTLANGDRLEYSVRTVIPYTGDTFNVCELVIPVTPFEQGDYQIQLYLEDTAQLSTTLTLK